MGAGKTTLGKEIAKKMNLRFLDLDKMIMSDEGRTINQIFEEKGEKSFRKTERKVLEKILESDNYLLACGGGTPCYKDNMEQMNAKGVSLFLDVPEEELVRRLSRNQASRPLLSDLNDQELKEYIHKKLEGRQECYRKSKIWINPLATSVDTIIISLRYS
jgi:shikimate kinase